MGTNNSKTDNTGIFRAVETADIDSIRSYLLEDSNVNAVDPGTGNYLLHQAVRSGSMECVRLIIKHGSSVNHKNLLGQTPLMIATLLEQTQIIGYLIDEGANVKRHDRQGNTILHLAVTKSQTVLSAILKFEKCRYIINEQNKNKHTALTLAVRSGNLECTNMLLNAGAVDTFSNIGTKDEQDTGVTSLWTACANGYHPVVELLLKYDSKYVNTTNSIGQTPLMALLKNSRDTSPCDTAKLLLDKGADINTGDLSGKTVLHYTVLAHHTDIGVIQLLLERDVDVNATDNNGYTALLIAIENIESLFDICNAICDLLIEKGANVNIPNEDGLTPLLSAVQKQNADFYEDLLSHGASVSHVDNSGKNAFHWSAYKGCGGRVIEHLQQFAMSEDATKPDNNGITPLMYAVINNNPDTCSALLKVQDVHTILLDREPKTGNTAAHFMALNDDADNLRHIFHLLENIPNIKQQLLSSVNQKGETILSVATNATNVDCVRVIEDQDDSLNIVTLIYNHEFDRASKRLLQSPDLEAVHDAPVNMLLNVKVLSALEAAIIYAAPLEFIKHLLKAGANVNGINPDDEATIIQRAIFCNRRDALALFLDCGASLSCSNDASTALYMLTSNECDLPNISIKHFLEKGGCRILNQYDPVHGVTPLWNAVRSGKEGAVAHLLLNDANPNKGSNCEYRGFFKSNGFHTICACTPLECALYTKQLPIIQLLLMAGAYPDCREHITVDNEQVLILPQTMKARLQAAVKEYQQRQATSPITVSSDLHTSAFSSSRSLESHLYAIEMTWDPETCEVRERTRRHVDFTNLLSQHSLDCEALNRYSWEAVLLGHSIYDDSIHESIHYKFQNDRSKPSTEDQLINRSNENKNGDPKPSRPTSLTIWGDPLNNKVNDDKNNNGCTVAPDSGELIRQLTQCVVSSKYHPGATIQE